MLGTDSATAGETLRSSAADPGDSPGSLLRRTGGFLLRHGPVLLLLAAATALRTLVSYAYWPAFWFADDSRQYLRAMTDLRPGVTDRANGVGYPVFLRLLSPIDSLGAVAIAQHLICLALAVGIYVVLCRRGVPGWLAALGTVPLLFDGRQLVTEHYVLSDSVFTALIVAAALVLLWREQPGVAAYAVSGALLVAAITVRTVGIGLVLLFVLYLVIRRVGWQRFAAFALAVLIGFGSYVVWHRAETGSFALSSKQGRFLFSRVASIADCSRLELTPAQRELCPSQPLGQRPERADYYIWRDKKTKAVTGPGADERLGEFAGEVIRQQPGDYLALISGDLAKYLLPGQEVGRSIRCLATWSTFPPQLGDEPPRCQPFTASTDGFSPDPQPVDEDRSLPMQDVLSDYSRTVQVPPALSGLAVLLGVVALVLRPKRGRWADGLDAALLVGIGLTLLVVSVATSMYSIRYGIPPLTLFGAGAALAAYRVWVALRTPRPPAAEPEGA